MEDIFYPDSNTIESSRVQSLLKHYGVKDAGALRKKSVEDIEDFWKFCNNDLEIPWISPFKRILDPSHGLEATQWFIGGKTNIALACLDRHRNKKDLAILWEDELGNHRDLTYPDLATLVDTTAFALSKAGISKGDCVGLLMPMVPEVVIQLMACFKVGASAIPIFSGFGANSIVARLNEAKAKLLFATDGTLRRGKPTNLLPVLNEIKQKTPTLKEIVCLERFHKVEEFTTWKKFISQPAAFKTVAMESEDTSLILFTSGTTGNPKGAVHTHAGCLATIAKEHAYAFNNDSKSRFFWFTDMGWMMGPWEVIGTLFFGGTVALFEGAPDYPSPTRLWEFVEKNGLTHLGLSPTVIRLLKKDQTLEKFQFEKLEYLGSTGETWDPESYQWFFSQVGKKRCPILNISGGTEIIGCLLSPLPIEPIKSCSLGGPALGADVDVFDEQGKSVTKGIGHLVCKQPLPSMTKGFLNSWDRYLKTYFDKFPGVWYHGDWAEIDRDNRWFLRGRSDDTIKVAGKRIGPAEYESILMSEPGILEAVTVSVPDSLKGEIPVCFVVAKTQDETLKANLERKIGASLGKAFLPKAIHFVKALPKTRSGKIVRATIRKVYMGESVDLSSVENWEAIDALKNIA